MMSNEDSKVTVIIPAYNRAKYIHQTVESVLTQTFKDIELIVVDDGSNDGTREILEKYGSQIKLMEHEGRKNKGQSAALNLGLRHAGGKYIAILDSDDYWESEKVAIQFAYLEKHPEIGLVYCNGKAVNENGEYLYDIYSSGHTEHNQPERLLLDCYILLPQNALFRKELLEMTGNFDESLRSAQDHDMVVRLAEVTKFAYLDVPVFYYRRHAQSISQKNAELRWRNGFIILSKAKKRFPYTDKVIRKRMAVLHYRLFQCFREKRKILSALFHLILSGVYDPLRAINVIRGIERISGHH